MNHTRVAWVDTPSALHGASWMLKTTCFVNHHHRTIQLSSSIKICPFSHWKLIKLFCSMIRKWQLVQILNRVTILSRWTMYRYSNWKWIFTRKPAAAADNNQSVRLALYPFPCNDSMEPHWKWPQQWLGNTQPSGLIHWAFNCPLLVINRVSPCIQQKLSYQFDLGLLERSPRSTRYRSQQNLSQIFAALKHWARSRLRHINYGHL